MQFEWDADKAALNLKKHGVRFETAALVFNDENRIGLFDSAHSLSEDRYAGRTKSDLPVLLNSVSWASGITADSEKPLNIYNRSTTTC